jgi:hypothetical protein
LPKRKFVISSHLMTWNETKKSSLLTKERKCAKMLSVWLG